MSSNNGKRTDLIVIGKEATVVKRCKDLAASYDYSLEVLSTVDEFADRSEEYGDISFIVVSAVSANTEIEISGMVQVARQFATKAYIVVIANKKISPETAVFTKKSGASLVLLEHEALYNSKLDFITTQILRASFLPIKVSELKKDTTPDFIMYHMMPLNKKFVPLYLPGMELTEAKLKKAETLNVSEIYILREDAIKYKKYIEQNQDRSAAGLKSRCRAQYVALSSAFTDLVLMISDESEYASYDLGKSLYEKCANLADDLIMSLGAIGDAFDIINNSAVGSFGSVDRAPAVGAYASLFSLMANIGNPRDVMLAAMLADVGMLEMEPKTMAKLRMNGELTAEQKVEYEKHPIFSLNKVLARKLPIPENLKQIILCTHERSDRRGFPEKIQSQKIPEESQLILFSQMVDKECIVEMGKHKVAFTEAREKILSENENGDKAFTISLIMKLRKL